MTNRLLQRESTTLAILGTLGLVPWSGCTPGDPTQSDTFLADCLAALQLDPIGIGGFVKDFALNGIAALLF